MTASMKKANPVRDSPCNLFGLHIKHYVNLTSLYLHVCSSETIGSMANVIEEHFHPIYERIGIGLHSSMRTPSFKPRHKESTWDEAVGIDYLSRMKQYITAVSEWTNAMTKPLFGAYRWTADASSMTRGY
jgi:hypothetical protein